MTSAWNEKRNLKNPVSDLFMVTDRELRRYKQDTQIRQVSCIDSQIVNLHYANPVGAQNPKSHDRVLYDRADSRHCFSEWS